MAGANNSIGSSLAGSSLGQILAPQGRLTPRSETAKAAQKAFFQAALNPSATTAAAAQATVAAQTAVAPAAAPTRSSSSTGGLNNFDPDNPPDRILRPGSLVNIVV